MSTNSIRNIMISCSVWSLLVTSIFPNPVADPGFPDGKGVSTPEFENLLFDKIFAENYMKMKDLGLKGASIASPLIC